ncbi:MAG: NAD(P)H-dependent glycerol-3-phosphate dehydrogenase [Candidatus Omnitrophota bacterium]|nr:NAD(P)H-dependent glycerol-3-phosphate dehydrogenase [Candidatus Omnitrophota bacterium]
MNRLNRMKHLDVAVLGDGGWGTTLSILLQRKGHRITLWGAFSENVSRMRKHRRNDKFLPGVNIPARIEITGDLKSAVGEKTLIIFAIPSQYLRGVLKKIKNFSFPEQAIFLSVTKGIEGGTLKRMSQVIHEELGRVKLAVLSGPTIAREVAHQLPTTAVIAARDVSLRKYLQDIFATERFRVYTNADVAGVELGGSLKNIIAIACGISDGLEFGTNTKAAILSRGLAEISRLGRAMGANAGTFSGLSGLGDLVTTCVSPYSRNRYVGEQIGRGKSLRQIQGGMQMVAEGVPTAKSAYALSLRYKVDMPITREVYRVLFKNKSPLAAVKELMNRQKKEE